MTRLITTGYETGDVNEIGVSTIGTNGTISVVSSTPTARSGSYCLKVATTSSTFAATYKSISLAAAKTEVWLRCAVYIHPLTSSVEWAILGWQESLGGGQACLTWDAGSNVIRARQGNTVGGALLATSSGTMAADAWHLLEWRHQMTSITVGVTEVWLDGTRVINFSGDNTSNSTLNVLTLLAGQTSATLLAAAGAYIAFDDLAINDVSGTLNNGRPGDGRVVLLAPTGAGSNTALTRGGTDSGANWSQVEELPPSMTDYVFGATAALRDTYALSDLPAGVASVNVAEVLVLAQNSDAGAGSLGLTVKSGATTNEGTAQTLGTSAAYFRQQYETDPATAVAWTTSAINAMEAGVTVR